MEPAEHGRPIGIGLPDFGGNAKSMATRNRLSVVAGVACLLLASSAKSLRAESMYVYGVHDWGWGVNVDVMNWLTGWVTEACMAYDRPNVFGRYEPMAGEGFSIIQRLEWYPYKPIPPDPADYPTFASQCANNWAQELKKFCRHYSIGNEVDMAHVTPQEYAECFVQVRNAIRAKQPEAKVLIGHWTTDGYYLDVIHEIQRITGGNEFDGLTAHSGSTVPDGLLRMLDDVGAAPGVGVYMTEWGWVADSEPYSVSLARMLGFCQQIRDWNSTHARQLYGATWYRWPCWDSTFHLDDDCNVADNAAFKYLTANCPATNSYALNPVIISGVRVEVSTTGKALGVRWETNYPSKTMLWYWNSSANPRNGEFIPLDTSLVQSHVITLDNVVHVQPATEYLMICRSPAWDLGDGSAGPFKVTSGPWTVTVEETTDTTATLRWATLFASSSRVKYGLTADYGSEAVGPGNVTDHVMQITGLAPITTYHFLVWSEAQGYAPHHSADFTFRTGLPEPDPDLDDDGDVDQSDFGLFQVCLSGPGIEQNLPGCLEARLDPDEDVDQADFAIFLACLSGAGVPAASNCAK